MIDPAIEKRIQEVQAVAQNQLTTSILTHIHDGNFSQRINFFDIFGFIEPVNVISQTVGTAAGNYDAYLIAPVTGRIIQIDFSGVDALATSNTNYITWTVTNLGQSGAGSTAVLSTADSNTTKTTGGSALSANTKRTLVLNSTVNNQNIIQGDRILLRAAVTGTLANTVTFPVYLLQVQTQ